MDFQYVIKSKGNVLPPCDAGGAGYYTEDALVMSKSKIDMTKGSIMKNVLLFAIPIVIGNILQQLYTTVDTLVIGNYCGHESLAAVGTSAQPVEVLLCIFLGIGTGISILVSQYTGAGAIDKLIDLCDSAVSFLYMCGLPITVLGLILAPYMLSAMGVPDDVMEYAIVYTRIIFLGTLGNLGYNLNAGILRGLGDSSASLWFLVVSCITNIVLDLLFVAGLGMGAGGAALSTSLAMYISWLVSVIYIKKRFPEIKFTLLPRRFSKAELKSIIAIGLPIGLNNSLYSFGHVALQSMVNAQGSVFMAGISVAGRITGCSNIAITALSSAATTFSGQNYGAKNYKRLKEGHILIPAVSGAITICFGLIFIGVRMPLLRFFSKEEMVLMYASRYVVTMLLSQWLYAVFNGIMCIVNGVGLVKYTTIVNILMLWAVRVPTAAVITKFFDGTFVMLCYPVSFGFAAVCMICYYAFSKKWKSIMQMGIE